MARRRRASPPYRGASGATPRGAPPTPGPRGRLSPAMSRGPAIGTAIAAVACVGSVAVLSGAVLLAAGTWDSEPCDPQLDRHAVPAALVPPFNEAAAAYDLGPDGPAMLAALTSVESGIGRDAGRSSAGAVGWTQFLPGTWARFGVDADGDGRRDPMNAADAIQSTANYLHHLGAPGDWARALFGYNHSNAYVAEVLKRASAFAQPGANESRRGPMCETSLAAAVERIYG